MSAPVGSKGPTWPAARSIGPTRLELGLGVERFLRRGDDSCARRRRRRRTSGERKRQRSKRERANGSIHDVSKNYGDKSPKGARLPSGLRPRIGGDGQDFMTPSARISAA